MSSNKTALLATEKERKLIEEIRKIESAEISIKVLKGEPVEIGHYREGKRL